MTIDTIPGWFENRIQHLKLDLTLSNIFDQNRTLFEFMYMSVDDSRKEQKMSFNCITRSII